MLRELALVGEPVSYVAETTPSVVVLNIPNSYSVAAIPVAEIVAFVVIECLGVASQPNRWSDSFPPRYPVLEVLLGILRWRGRWRINLGKKL